MLDKEQLQHNLKMMSEGFDHLDADTSGVLSRSSSFSFGRSKRLAKALFITLQAVVKEFDVHNYQEQLEAKDVIIDTLQAQIDTLSEQPVSASTPLPVPPEPLAAPESKPDFIVEEEHALLTANTAQELKKLDKLLEGLENETGEVVKALPPPLSLAREIGLASTGRTPRPSDEENLMNLRRLYDRITALHERWQQQCLESSPDMTASSAQPGTGWLELSEAEVKELEITLGRAQQLHAENERLKIRITELEKEGP